jgi:hypothetical protein
MSIFFTGNIASTVRLASTPPAASASRSARVEFSRTVDPFFKSITTV